VDNKIVPQHVFLKNNIETADANHISASAVGMSIQESSSEEKMYFYYFLKVLANCINVKSAFIENIFNYLTSKNINDYLRIPRLDLSLKYGLLQVYNNIYVNSEKMIPPHKSQNAQEIWEFIIQEFCAVCDPV
jgi:hypothetical protein